MIGVSTGMIDGSPGSIATKAKSHGQLQPIKI